MKRILNLLLLVTLSLFVLSACSDDSTDTDASARDDSSSSAWGDGLTVGSSANTNTSTDTDTDTETEDESTDVDGESTDTEGDATDEGTDTEDEGTDTSTEVENTDTEEEVVATDTDTDEEVVATDTDTDEDSNTDTEEESTSYAHSIQGTYSVSSCIGYAYGTGQTYGPYNLTFTNAYAKVDDSGNLTFAFNVQGFTRTDGTSTDYDGDYTFTIENSAWWNSSFATATAATKSGYTDTIMISNIGIETEPLKVSVTRKNNDTSGVYQPYGYFSECQFVKISDEVESDNTEEEVEQETEQETTDYTHSIQGTYSVSDCIGYAFGVQNYGPFNLTFTNVYAKVDNNGTLTFAFNVQGFTRTDGTSSNYDGDYVFTVAPSVWFGPVSFTAKANTKSAYTDTITIMNITDDVKSLNVYVQRSTNAQPNYLGYFSCTFNKTSDIVE